MAAKNEQMIRVYVDVWDEDTQEEWDFTLSVHEYESLGDLYPKIWDYIALNFYPNQSSLDLPMVGWDAKLLGERDGPVDEAE